MRSAGSIRVMMSGRLTLRPAASVNRAEAAGVAYIPGARFHTTGGGANALRLAFSLYKPEELLDAAARLGDVIREAVR